MSGMSDNRKRILAIAGISLIALFVLMRRRSTTGTATGTSPTGGVTPYTPQAPVTLTAGESVYDPNSQNLLTTPQGWPPQAFASQAPTYIINYGPKKTHSSHNHHKTRQEHRQRTHHAHGTHQRHNKNKEISGGSSFTHAKRKRHSG